MNIQVKRTKSTLNVLLKPWIRITKRDSVLEAYRISGNRTPLPISIFSALITFINRS